MSSIVGDLTIKISSLESQLKVAETRVRQFKHSVENETGELGKKIVEALKIRELGNLEPLGATGAKIGGVLGALGPGGAAVGVGLGALLGTLEGFHKAAEYVKEVALGFQELEANAAKLHTSTQSLQRLAAGAAETHTDMQTLMTDLMHLREQAGDPGATALNDTLERMGLKLSEIKSLQPDQLILRLRKALRESPTAELDARALLGRGYRDSPILFEGDDDKIAKTMADASTQTREEVEMMANLNREWEKLGRTIEMAGKSWIVTLVARMGTAFDILGIYLKNFGDLWNALVSPAKNGPGRTEELKGAWENFQASMREFLVGKMVDKIIDAGKSAGGVGEEDVKTKEHHDKIKDLQDAADRQSHDFLPKPDIAAGYRKDLAEALGVAVKDLPTTVAGIQGALAKLQAGANKAGAAGSYSLQMSLLQRKVDAGQALEQLGHMDLGSTHSPKGTVASQVDWIMGRSSGEMVAQRVAEGNSLLQKIVSEIQILNSRDRPHNKGGGGVAQPHQGNVWITPRVRSAHF